jgi:hypothetical protein
VVRGSGPAGYGDQARLGARIAPGGRAARRVALGGAIALALLVLGELSPGWLPVRVTLDAAGATARISMDGGEYPVSLPELPAGSHLRFEQPGPVQREYQIDGSDTTARADRDQAQFRADQTAPWYVLMGWLRDEGSYSRWQDVRLIDASDGHVVATGADAVAASRLPAAFRLEAALRRPEAPARIWVESPDGTRLAGLSIERDSHRASWQLGEDDDQPTQWFFPNDPWPFAAELTQLVGRSAVAAFGQLASMAGLGWLLTRGLPLARRRVSGLPPLWVAAGFVLVVWFTAVVWITVRVYHQLPHIVDAQAYYFQARIFETGRTWLAQPDIIQMLDGFQQVEVDGRWYSQYPPGAPALFALGGLVGLAWLVGPLATLALAAATAMAGMVLFDRWVGFTALALVCLSPFVLFQAGSFMSHPVAGGAAACSLAAFASAWRTDRRAWYLVTGALLGAAFDTREVVAVLYGVPYAVWLIAHRRWRGLAWTLVAGLPFLAVYLLFNLSTTGNPLLLPRNLFNPDDRWGFGALGSFGEHTPAAGLVNTDENLTLLQFDLFGWPPLAALGLIALPFLLGRATRFDVLLAACAGGFVLAYVGYFYQGIALGPRYYFEAVPALTLLAARGVQASVQTLRTIGLSGRAALAGAGLVLALLSGWTVAYYLPHAVNRRMDYAALGNGRRLVLPFVESTLGGPRFTDDLQAPALVVVPNEDVFKTISALNCPLLEDAYLADCPVLLLNASLDEVTPLFARFPNRSVWLLQTQGDVATLQRIRMGQIF